MRRKILILLAPIIAVTAIAAYLLWPRTYYIGSYDGKIKIPVPQEIIASKDCDAYVKFVESLARPGFVPDPSCPWASFGPIGHFTIGKTEFQMPREYLLFSKHEKDGVVESLSLMFVYPDMNPGTWEGKQDYHINVSIRGIFEGSRCQKTKTCDRADLDSFHLKIPKTPFIDYPQDCNPQKPSLKRRYDEYIDQYDYCTPTEYYVRGDPLNPDYWIECTPERLTPEGNPNRRCETVFMLQDDMIITYGFNRAALLQHHWELRQKVEEKIRSFITQGEK